MRLQTSDFGPQGNGFLCELCVFSLRLTDLNRKGRKELPQRSQSTQIFKGDDPFLRHAMLMSSYKEVEIKFRISNLRDLKERMQRAHFRLHTPRTHEMNTLYDLPGNPLRRRGDLLRLRKYGSEWVLTHKAKGRDGRHKTRAETETKIADGKQMEGIVLLILNSTSFPPQTSIE